VDASDFVAGSSSPAAPSRSSQTVSRNARRWLLGNLRPALSPGECPEGRTGRHAVPATRQPLSGAGERCRSGLFNGDVTVCQDTRAEFTAL